MGVDAEMMVRVSPPLSERQVKRISWELAGAFGPESFFILREKQEWSDAHGALRIIDVYEQDGPDIRPKANEQLIRVYLSGRYYGEDYERGDIVQILGIAEWLERRIAREPNPPKVAVWYGGDSSGIKAKPLGKQRRSALFEHFVHHGHRPYTSYRDGPLNRDCSFCSEPMRQYMFGGPDIGGFTCDGCGTCEVTHDGGKSWEPDNSYHTRITPKPEDGATGWVRVCIEHPDCRESAELGLSCYLASIKAKRKKADVPPAKP